MVHMELIPLTEYSDNFDVPFMAEFAKACQEHIKLTGVKNCFLLECPIFFPGDLKPMQLLFQRKGEDAFECSDNGTIAQHINPQNMSTIDFLTELGIEYKNNRLIYLLYAENNLKDQLLDQLNFFRMWYEDSEDYYYGIQFPFRLASGYFYSLFLSPKVNGTYTLHQEFDFAANQKLCDIFDIQVNGQIFDMTLPNVNTRYAIRRLLDFVQFIFLSEHPNIVI